MPDVPEGSPIESWYTHPQDEIAKWPNPAFPYAVEAHRLDELSCTRVLFSKL